MSNLAVLAVIFAFFWVVSAVALRPWYTRLHLAELPGALLVYLAGPGYRRQLRARLLRRREAADEKLTVPVTPARQDFSLRSRAGAGWGYLPGSRYCQCAGHEAARARAEHERYEREFAAFMPPGTITARLLPPGTVTYHPGLPPGAAHLSGAGYVSFFGESPEIPDDQGRSL